MATRTVKMKSAREVIRLSTLNNSIRKIKKLTGISRTAIKNILSQVSSYGCTLQEVLFLNDLQLKEIVYPHKDNLDPRFQKLKKDIPGILSKLNVRYENLSHQWELYILNNPTGYSYSQFCHHLLKEQKKDIRCDAVFQYSFGDTLFVDYAGDTVSYTGLDGVSVSVRVFVSILPASQYVFAGLSKRATSADWVEQTTRAFEYFGGVPRAVIPDCDKAVVDKADRYQATINHHYQKLAEHYSTTIIPARPSSPQDKALVEGAVNNIYRYIYPRLKDRACHSFEELEEYFSELLEKFNGRIMRRFNKSRTQMFGKYEKKTLCPLADTRYLFQKYQSPRMVGATSHIYLKEDKNYYSIPYRFIGEKCEIYYTLRVVTIHCNNEIICSHIRDTAVGKYNTIPNHLTTSLKNYFSWGLSQAKEKARGYDPVVEQVVVKIYESKTHHLQARKNIYGVFHLAEKVKYKADGSLDYKHTPKYDSKGKMIEMAVYISGGPLYLAPQ